MLTGRQVREARKLLQWSRVALSRNASVTQATVAAIESTDGTAWLSEGQEATIRCALEAGGVIFIPESGGGVGVRLRKAEKGTES